MTNKITTLLLVAGAFSIALTSDSLGHGGGGDISMYETNGQVDVGFAILDDDDIEQLFFDPTDRVFNAILPPLDNPPPFIPWQFGSSEPGFDANEGNLPTNAEISWNLLALGYWDGAGEAAFLPSIDVEAGYAPQPDLSDTMGGFHAHPTFGLRSTIDGLQPAEGVYLAELTASVVGLEDSDPFYLVTLIDEEINNAADPVTAAEDLGLAVRDFLSGDTDVEPTLGGKNFVFYGDAVRYAEGLAIPEPTSLLLVLAALGTLGTGRNR